MFSHAAAFRSARDAEGSGACTVGGAVFVFLFLDGVDDVADVDGIASSFVDFRFGIAPDGRRVSGVGVPEEDVALDVDAIAGTGDGAGRTATGVMSAPACFNTKSSRWYRVSDKPRSAARLTIILSIPYA